MAQRWSLDSTQHPDLIGHLVLLEGRDAWMLVKSRSADTYSLAVAPNARGHRYNSEYLRSNLTAIIRKFIGSPRSAVDTDRVTATPTDLLELTREVVYTLKSRAGDTAGLRLERAR